MSRKPYPAGAKKVIELIDRTTRLAREIKTLREKVQRLKEAEEEHQRFSRELHGLIKAMDCESLGNAGWQGRITWLIAEILKQDRAER